MSYTDFDFPHSHFYDTDLRELLCKFKKAEEAIAALEEWKNEVNPTIEDLKALYDAMMSGELPEAIQEAIRQWLMVNAIDLMGELIKNVYFGLTNDGYFCAFIPKSWSWVTFDTITDGDDPLYGHLILMYD